MAQNFRLVADVTPKGDQPAAIKALTEGILAGNSIYMDRLFLAKYMPGFERYLHYRMLDVSSLKVLTRAWFPNAPGRTKDDASHTVLSDLRASIAELAHYQQTFFKAARDI